jgi:hypothetical protein
MAEPEQELTTGEAGRKTGSMTNRSGRGRAWRKKAVRKSGTERLRQAADKRLGWNSKKLADLLMERALTGDLATVKVLVGIAERMEPIPEKEREVLFRPMHLTLGPAEGNEEDEFDVGNRER